MVSYGKTESRGIKGALKMIYIVQLIKVFVTFLQRQLEKQISIQFVYQIIGKYEKFISRINNQSTILQALH